MAWRRNDDQTDRTAPAEANGQSGEGGRTPSVRPPTGYLGAALLVVLAVIASVAISRPMAQQAESPTRYIDPRVLNETIDQARPAGEPHRVLRAELDRRLARMQSLFAESAGPTAAGERAPGAVADDPVALAERVVAEAKVLSSLLAQTTQGRGAATVPSGRRSAELARLIAEYEARLAAMEKEHRETIADLRAENTRLAADKSAVFAELQRQTRDFYASATRIIQQTGLDADALLAEAGFGNAGQGGPFLAAENLAAFETGGASARLSLGEVAALRRVMQSLPLAAPLKEYRITSRFGPRRDPFNGRKAIHEGVDLSAPFASDVFATAPGRVVAAGRWGGYGLAIEIDHGAGLTTRFGHLSSIRVKEGDTVAFGAHIGDVGSSGRSTGPHLHYEVRFTNRPKDPLAFIRAGDDVFQTGEVAADIGG